MFSGFFKSPYLAIETKEDNKVSIGIQSSELVKEKIPKEVMQQIKTKIILACDKSPDYKTLIFDPDLSGGTAKEEDEGKTVRIGMSELINIRAGKVYASRVHYDTVEDLQKALDIGAEGQDLVTLLLEEEY
jgi:hypothetical protein